MNTLLIFFALPVATVILAVVLQKILRNPILVAATFFAIYLIITFAFFDASFLVYAILYTILAYVTAVLARWICRLAVNATLLSSEMDSSASGSASTSSSNSVSSNSNCNCYYRRRFRN